jgi:hypothetical protein
MKKSKIGENGYHLVEETLSGAKCITLMYGSWYILRFNKGLIELAASIDDRAFKLDDRGCVQISNKTC